MQGQPADEGRKCLFIASEVRSGSTYVAEALSYAFHGTDGFELWDLAKEHFSGLNDDSTPQEALTILRSLFLDRSGFVASKFMCKSLSYLHRLAQASPELHAAFFGDDAYWVVVRRRDEIEQAVSLAMAAKSGVFHHYDESSPAPDADVTLTLEDLDAALKAIALSDLYLETFAASLPQKRVLTVFYKDFLADEAGYIAKVRQLCGFPKPEREEATGGAKVRPTGRRQKRREAARLREWFLANYA